MYEGQVHGFAFQGDWRSEKDKKMMDDAEKQGMERSENVFVVRTVQGVFICTYIEINRERTHIRHNPCFRNASLSFHFVSAMSLESLP